MRISDWSSDVCSSDLASVRAGRERSSASSPGPGGASLGAQAPSSKSSVRKGSRIGCSVAASEASAPPRSRRGIITAGGVLATRSEEHTSELQSLMRISYAVFCLKKKKKQQKRAQTK